MEIFLLAIRSGKTSLCLRGSGAWRLPRTSQLPTFLRKPGVWDPLVGLDWRRKFGRKVYVQLRGDGGAALGWDVDVDLEARVEWRFAKHFGLLGGYEALHYQISGNFVENVAGQTLKYPWQLRQTGQNSLKHKSEYGSRCLLLYHGCRRGFALSRSQLLFPACGKVTGGGFEVTAYEQFN
jgi:hypothetical protein